ncbi:DUF7715 family protein [Agromyces aerolatus]|uniref:DUF7715 family protein n=1 Tax=Agromyces sp. LY-1074 TaxID=3074080 RepID=UPI00285A438A|nr:MULTISPECIES: hypothetical protein [unclassified Agromyces]MDR5698556.1 hypothetical protein [Agromyces sp. LY-1074]MDR5704850.1 hypothetical protein [Agromyces sp. LY-1358]
MRILTVTARTQGERAGDFCFGMNGELAWIPGLCAAAILRPDETLCQCRRAFGGVSSGAPSSTALVVETDWSRREIVLLMRTGAAANQWEAACIPHVADEMLAVAARWPTGAVLERSFVEFRARSVPKAESGV